MPVVTPNTHTYQLSVMVLGKFVELGLNVTEFSDGAEAVKICNPEDIPAYQGHIIVRIDAPKVPDDTMKLIMRLALLLDAISEHGCEDLKVSFNVAYMPFARADRKFDTGMGIPLRAFMRMLHATVQTIPSMSLGSVHMVDVHNFDAVASYANDVDYSNMCAPIPGPYSLDSNETVIIAPDKGATKRARSIAMQLRLDDYQALKVRDPRTGKLSDTRLDFDPDVVRGKTAIIVDDICDGGGTFIPLAKLLYEAGATDVCLMVNHLIASKGLQPLKDAKITLIYRHQVCNYF